MARRVRVPRLGPLEYAYLITESLVKAMDEFELRYDELNMEEWPEEDRGNMPVMLSKPEMEALIELIPQDHKLLHVLRAHMRLMLYHSVQIIEKEGGAHGEG